MMMSAYLYRDISRLEVDFRSISSYTLRKDNDESSINNINNIVSSTAMKMSPINIITVSEISHPSASSSPTSSSLTYDDTDYFTYKGIEGYELSPSSLYFLKTHPAFTPPQYQSRTSSESLDSERSTSASSSYAPIANKSTSKNRISTPVPAIKKRSWPALTELPLLGHAATIYKQH